MRAQLRSVVRMSRPREYPQWALFVKPENRGLAKQPAFWTAVIRRTVSADRASYRTIGPEAEGQRLDNYLIRIAKGVPEGHIYRDCARAKSVNKGRVAIDYRLAAGDQSPCPSAAAGWPPRLVVSSSSPPPLLLVVVPRSVTCTRLPHGSSVWRRRVVHLPVNTVPPAPSRQQAPRLRASPHAQAR